MASAVSSLTYRAPSGPGTASAGRPQRLPSALWNPVTRVPAVGTVVGGSPQDWLASSGQPRQVAIMLQLPQRLTEKDKVTRLPRPNRADWHAHFTGSLPARFLVAHAQQDGNRNLLIRDLGDFLPDILAPMAEGPASADDPGNAITLFRNALSNAFSSGGRRGLDAFIKIYDAIQRSHSQSATGVDSYAYHSMAYSEIISSNARARVGKILLFTSFDENMDLLSTKLRAAQAARSRQHEIQLNIRLTLPREAERVRRFAAGGGFDNLLHILESQSGFEGLITSLDFSGFESMDDWSITSELISEAAIFARKHGLGVSVHIGEDVYCVDPYELLERFAKIYDLGVTWLCHASFLWLDEALLRSEPSTSHMTGFERERADLRQYFGARQTTIDICPSTSLATQVIRHARHIPIALLEEEGFKIRIGTDNPTLVGTTLRREYNLLGLSF